MNTDRKNHIIVPLSAIIIRGCFKWMQLYNFFSNLINLEFIYYNKKFCIISNFIYLIHFSFINLAVIKLDARDVYFGASMIIAFLIKYHQ